MRDLPREALNIEDLRRMARRRLTKAVFEFCDRGSEDEIAMRDNRAALDRIKLLPRVLTDVSGRDPGITLFGKKHALPLLIAPTGFAGWVWYRAESLWRAPRRMPASPLPWRARRAPRWRPCWPRAAAPSGSSFMFGATPRPRWSP